MASRRDILSLLMAASLLGLAAPSAYADDDGGGDSDGGSDSGGSSGSSGRSDDGGSDHSGSHGGGSDDSGSDHEGSDSSGSSGSGGSNSGSSHNDDDDDNDDDEQTHARKAVARGEAIALKQVLTNVGKKYPGRVVSVSLKGNGTNLRYRIRVIDNKNRLLDLLVNARNGQITRID